MNNKLETDLKTLQENQKVLLEELNLKTVKIAELEKEIESLEERLMNVQFYYGDN